MKYATFLFFFICSWMNSQTIENAKSLQPFIQKLKSNTSVTSVLMLGDSHIQVGWISETLRHQFQKEYGNAGRGLVFPYEVANSNGAADVTSVSDQSWETFRLMYQQNYFKEMGALGFVMGNHQPSFIEIDFKNPEDAFDVVKILNDAQMNGDSFDIYQSSQPLKSFITYKKSRVNYTLSANETFPEVAAKFNTTTYRIYQLNRGIIEAPRPNEVIRAKKGMKVQIEKVEPVLNSNFKKYIQPIRKGIYSDNTQFEYPELTQKFLLFTNASEGNLLYGFQFLRKNAKKGVVFNTVGVNGSTYEDFLKYPLQMKQLRATQPDFVMIALGTNESFNPDLNKENFIKSVRKTIYSLRKENTQLPILIISPTDNRLEGEKIASIVQWLKEAVQGENVAFLNFYELTGGKAYYKKASQKKQTAADGIHFVKSGYEAQANLLWQEIEKILN